MNAITIEGLSKSYRSLRGKKTEALKNLNLQIKEGELFGFIGPNGAGKSTTIKLLVDLIRPTSGKAFLFDMDILNPGSRERIGYLPENPSYYDFLTASELLRFSGRIFGIKKSDLEKRIEKLLKLVDLYSVKDTPLRKYSKGMVQRAGLARALISDPDLLILDEPASGLDPVGRKLVIDIMRDLKKEGKTIFFSSHILHDIETICDRVGIIIDGVLRREEKISSLLSQSFREFEVTVHHIEMNRLKELSGKGYSYTHEGDMVKIRVTREKLWQLQDFLRRRDASLYSVEPKRKTMEEVFMDMVKGVRSDK